MLTSQKSKVEILTLNTLTAENLRAEQEYNLGSTYRSVVTQIQHFLPATLKRNPSRGWYIEFYVVNPATRMMVQRRIRLNKERKRYKRTCDFKTYANMLICQINAKLVAGWSPFEVQEEDTPQMVLTMPVQSPLPKVETVVPEVAVAATKHDEHEDIRATSMQEFIEKFKAEKERELRPDTMRSYSNFCSILLHWTEQEGYDKDFGAFDKKVALRFMEYVFQEREVSANTYNNYIKTARAIFSWAVEHCYLNENPFKDIRKKREEDKKRTLIPSDTRGEIENYLRQKGDKGMLLMCQLVCVSLIRPKEALNIRIKDIDMNTCTIRIPADVAKNHHERHAAFNQQVKDLLNEMHLDLFPDDYYVFGTCMQPGLEMASKTAVSKRWTKMRDKLHLPKEMQLYSLRDTGITSLIQSGVDPVAVMKHADHHDLSITTRYANHRDPKLAQKIFLKSEF